MKGDIATLIRFVIPAKAGIQYAARCLLDSRLRGYDRCMEVPLSG